MSKREFIFKKTVYLVDTNIFGNVYFAHYFEWQGMAREEFFKQIFPDKDKFLQLGIKFITLEASVKYHRELTLFEEVIIKVIPDNIKLTTFELIFTYLNKKTGQLVAEGRQKIGFVDSTGKVIPIPKELKEAWRKFKQR